MRIVKKILGVLLVLAVLLSVIFCVGRYGWKLAGFRACQSAGITSVAVEENAVHLTGFYPGSFPEGFVATTVRSRTESSMWAFDSVPCSVYLRRETLLSPFLFRGISTKSLSKAE